MGNNFGKIFRLTTFGESHGKAIGGILMDVLQIKKLIYLKFKLT